MPLLSSLSKNVLPFLVLTFLWLAIAEVFMNFWSSFVWADTSGRLQLGFNVLFGEVAIMGLIHWMENRKTAKSEHAKLMEKIAPARVAVYEHLTQLPYFNLHQWCVLPSSREARTLAVNADRSRIAVLDYHLTPDRGADTPLITVKMFEAGDVESVEIEEFELGSSRTSPLLFSGDKAPVHLASELLGSAGLPIPNPRMLGQSESGHESAQERRVAPIASPSAVPAKEGGRLNRLRLKVKRTNSTESVNHFYFLVGEVNTSDEAYLFARENAQHWQALFEGLRDKGEA